MHPMKFELLQSISNFLIFVGAIIAALGGFGSQYFGKRISDAEKSKNDSAQLELKQNVENLLEGNETLKNRLIPFEELASKIHPTLKIDAALEKLQEDYQRLEEIASKYEFIELDKDIRAQTINRLIPVAQVFNQKKYKIQITHETWTNAATQRYTSQLADILREAGFKVEGPKQITYYLIQESSPIEWGISPGMLPATDLLFKALLPVFGSKEKWTKRTFEKMQDTLRLHFGGSTTFKKNGIATIQ